jgi:hypothetical protein
MLAMAAATPAFSNRAGRCACQGNRTLAGNPKTQPSDLAIRIAQVDFTGQTGAAEMIGLLGCRERLAVLNEGNGR